MENYIIFDMETGEVAECADYEYLRKHKEELNSKGCNYEFVTREELAEKTKIMNSR